mgnify:CR=1 FL=1
MAQSSSLVQAQRFLGEYIPQIPTYSTIDIALSAINQMSLQTTTNQGPVAVYSPPTGFDWGEKAIAISALRAIVTYLALQAFGYVSLCVNGAAGCGKVICALTASSINKEQLLKEGCFQVLTAVYDYAIGQFGFICSIFSLTHGGSPKWALDTHSKIFQAYKHAVGSPPAEDDLCLLQRMANTLQEIILPSNPTSAVNAS